MIKTARFVAGALALLCGDAMAQQQDDLSFARAYSASGVVAGSLEESAALAGVPPAAMPEALQAFASTLDLDRDVHDGDRFYVRYEEGFIIDGRTSAQGRVLWAELRLKGRKEPIAIHRFRALGAKHDSFWLASGQSTMPPELRLPVDIVVMSSGFGMRVDPMDQPSRFAVGGGSRQMPARAAVLPPGLISGMNNSRLLRPVSQPTLHGLALGLRPVSMGFTNSLTSIHPMELHQGIDLVAPPRTPIHAAAEGTVLGAEPKGPYGNWIEIEHEDGLATVYGHMSAFAPGIGRGVHVERGDVIGYVGMTGRTTGPHVHFELHVNGQPVNPMANPALKPALLRGLDLARFQKLVARNLAEREHEAHAM
jgi:murein DD-endopeptidase MepM/ murein hydrolase activator NlpD